MNCPTCKKEYCGWIRTIYSQGNKIEGCKYCWNQPDPHGIGYYTKQTLGWDSDGPLMMSPAEFNTLSNRHVNPDGSVSEKKVSYIDLRR